MAMMINQFQIRQAVPEVDEGRLNEFVASFNMWAIHFGIDSPKRIAHYLAQVMTESGALRYTVENLNYSKEGLLSTFPKYFNALNVSAYARNPQKIANRVYANRMGNGSEGSGDGYRYRGRGFIQLTGLDNYKAFAKSECCTEDVVQYPDKVANYYLNQVSSMWYWEKNKLNDIADKDDGKNGEEIVRQITRKVNGGSNGLAQRKEYYRKFKKVFKI